MSSSSSCGVCVCASGRQSGLRFRRGRSIAAGLVAPPRPLAALQHPDGLELAAQRGGGGHRRHHRALLFLHGGGRLGRHQRCHQRQVLAPLLGSGGAHHCLGLKGARGRQGGTGGCGALASAAAGGRAGTAWLALPCLLPHPHPASQGRAGQGNTAGRTCCSLRPIMPPSVLSSLSMAGAIAVSLGSRASSACAGSARGEGRGSGAERRPHCSSIDRQALGGTAGHLEQQQQRRRQQQQQQQQGAPAAACGPSCPPPPRGRGPPSSSSLQGTLPAGVCRATAREGRRQGKGTGFCSGSNEGQVWLASWQDGSSPAAAAAAAAAQQQQPRREPQPRTCCSLRRIMPASASGAGAIAAMYSPISSACSR